MTLQGLVAFLTMETKTHLPAALKEVAAERARIRKEIADLTAREAALARAEAGLRLLVPDEEPKLDLPEPPGVGKLRTNGNGYPRTTEAVRTVLKAREGKRYSVRAITRLVQQEGLLDPSLKRPYGTVLEASKRLANKDPRVIKLDRDGQLWFAYRSPSQAGAVQSSDEEGGDS